MCREPGTRVGAGRQNNGVGGMVVVAREKQTNGEITDKS